MIRFLLGAIVAGLLAVVAAVTLLWWSGGAAKAETVTVTEGATLTSLWPDLERRGLIPGTCTTYRLFARLLGDRPTAFRPASSKFRRRTSGAQLLDILQHGQPVQRLVTIPEGTPSILVAEKLAAVPYLAGPVPAIAEGLGVLPDSYSFARGEPRAAVAARMKAAMDKALAELWPKRKARPPAPSRPRRKPSPSPRSSKRKPASPPAPRGRGGVLQPRRSA